MSYNLLFMLVPDKRQDSTDVLMNNTSAASSSFFFTCFNLYFLFTISYDRNTLIFINSQVALIWLILTPDSSWPEREPEGEQYT